MKRVAALVPADELEGFTAWLHGRSLVHLTGIAEELPQHYTPSSTSDAVARDTLASYEQILAFCDAWGGAAKPFLDNMFSARTVARMSDLEAAAKKLDTKELLGAVVKLRERRDSVVQRIGTLDKEIERLQPFTQVEISLGSLEAFRHTRVALVRLARRAQEELEGLVPETVYCERLEQDLFWIASLAADATADTFMSSIGATSEDIPHLDQPVADRLDALRMSKGKLAEDLEEIESECRAFASRGREVELALAYWQSETHRLEGLRTILGSARIGVAHGYVPARELERLTDEVRTRFSGEVIAEDPQPGENVPVRLRVHPLLKPVTVLVNMFGLPDYFSIDPTAYITLTFLAFFGICYSDAIYGIALTAVAAGLMYKFRNNLGLRSFFQLFLYCGISTFIAGALLGTWAGDLYEEKYLGPGNPLLKVRNIFYMNFDPLKQAQLALVGAILIGIANQYFGIVLRMVRDIRKGDPSAAVYDGVFWLLYLTGIVILVSTLLTSVREGIVTAGTVMFVSGAVGLVLTQGRAEKGFATKAVTGVVSLYGIMGTYGATSFVGDALSYSRLMALGLTTGIVGQSFNVLAGIASDIPTIGIVLFVLVLVLGHVFNFLMSIIGAFVHAARLILLEFFGRFYEAGGSRFEPFGFRSERVEITGGGA